MIEVQIDDRVLLDALRDLQDRVGDLTPALHDIGQALVEGARARIRDGMDWNNQPFAPNRPATLARKRGAKPLIDTGHLVSARLHFRAGRDTLVMGSSAVQAGVLQFGANRGAFGTDKRGRALPWGDIPARPFLPIDGHDLPESALQVVRDTLADYLMDMS
ncbi:MAG: phage virion morphogenesis protein [Halothiobacillaceae bacterium]|nr:phage virion morphogenesis protein [Halothiobacillaceae bacterium]